jgi:hypothetical protein
VSMRAWGITPQEQELDYACDGCVEDASEAWYRGTDVEAPVALVYRWLCQLRIAPYSYDLIDNFGRRSPRTLTPGMDRLELGQRVMHVFSLVAFERDDHFTAQVVRARPLFMNTAVTYRVLPRADGGTRLLVKVVFRHTRVRVLRPFLRATLPLADTIMMRRQLATLRELAERDAVRAGAPA